MPKTFWEDVKKTVKQGVSVAAEKTEEYTRIGKVKVDILSLKRNLDKNMNALGGQTYEFLTSKKQGSLAANAAVKKIVEKIGELKKSIAAKEKEIDKIKKEVGDKPKKSTGEPE